LISLGFGVSGSRLLQCAHPPPLGGLLQIECGVARSRLLRHISSAISAFAVITSPTRQASPTGTVLLNSYSDLSTWAVSVGNVVGAEGAKALGDALKDNTTLTSLTLDLLRAYSWVSLVLCVSGFLLLNCLCATNAPLIGMLQVWKSMISTTKCIERAIVVSVRFPCCLPFTAVLLNYFSHSCVLAGNQIGDDGAKALGDALKDNTTLTSLWLSLRGEWLLFGGFKILCPYS
jgi:hypothetical protein